MLAAMVSRICICCGEPMPEKGGGLAGNPNVCAACAGIAAEMEEPAPPPREQPGQALPLQAEPPEPLRRAA